MRHRNGRSISFFTFISLTAAHCSPPATTDAGNDAASDITAPTDVRPDADAGGDTADDVMDSGGIDVTPPIDAGDDTATSETGVDVPADTGLPATMLPVDCRLADATTHAECTTIGTGASGNLVAPFHFGIYDSTLGAFYVTGANAILRVGRADHRRTVLSGTYTDPTSGAMTAGTGPLWDPDGLIAVRKMSGGSLLAMTTTGFYTVATSSGARTLYRTLPDVSPNTIRFEGRFAIDASDNIYVALGAGSAGAGVGIARLTQTTFDVVSLSGAADTTRNRGTGPSDDAAAYASLQLDAGVLYAVNSHANTLMSFDPATGARTVVSDPAGGIGSDTDGHMHAIASATGDQSLVIDGMRGVAIAHDTQVTTSSGDRAFASPFFTDATEMRRPENAIGHLDGTAIYVDSRRQFVYEVYGATIRAAELSSGNFNYVIAE